MGDRTARVHYVRLYHFLSAHHALDDIAKRRLKISEIEQLNDPFELWCVYQKDRRLRNALRGYKDQMAARFGMLCFSKHWHGPVLWSHYADRHRGICLGFDIDGRGAKPITYQLERPRLRIPPSRVDADQLLYTKFLDWQYEEEWRSWIQFDERDPATGFYFYNFESRVQLREVIAGPLCDVPEAKLREALSGYADKVSVIKARLAFRSFRVVKNLRGFGRIKLDRVGAGVESPRHVRKSTNTGKHA
jgi:Protein of unknown function (DUF2971)